MTNYNIWAALVDPHGNKKNPSLIGEGLCSGARCSLLLHGPYGNFSYDVFFLSMVDYELSIGYTECQQSSDAERIRRPIARNWLYSLVMS